MILIHQTHDLHNFLMNPVLRGTIMFLLPPLKIVDKTIMKCGYISLTKNTSPCASPFPFLLKFCQHVLLIITVMRGDVSNIFRSIRLPG